MNPSNLRWKPSRGKTRPRDRYTEARSHTNAPTVPTFAPHPIQPQSSPAPPMSWASVVLQAEPQATSGIGGIAAAAQALPDKFNMGLVSGGVHWGPSRGNAWGVKEKVGKSSGGGSPMSVARGKPKGKLKSKSKKPKPSKSTSLLDFIQDRRKDSEKKGKLGSGRSKVKGKGKGSGSGSGSGVSGGVKPIVVSLEKLEEQGLRQKGSSRSKKLSSLKKRIIKERELRSYLLTPSLQPYPLEFHPAFMGDLNGKSLVNQDPTQTHPAFFFHETRSKANEAEVKEVKEVKEVEESEEGNEEVVVASESRGTSVEANEVEQSTTKSTSKSKSKSSSKYYHAQVKESTRVPRTLEKGAEAYRDYVDQAFSVELETALYAMVSKLRDLQRRQQLRDPLKAKLRRRFVVGLREVHKGVKLGKVKCVVIAANIEMGMQGLIEEGIDSVVSSLIDACKPDLPMGRWGVPIIFAPSRTRLGKALGKHVSISALGVYSPDGANEEYNRALTLSKALRQVWKERVETERASKVWTRCCRCNQVAVKTYYLCQACDSTYCLSCKQSIKDRRIHCAKGGAPEDKDRSCSPTCLAISRSIPVPSDINKREQEAKKGEKEAKPRKSPRASAQEWSPQQTSIPSFGLQAEGYEDVCYLPSPSPTNDSSAQEWSPQQRNIPSFGLQAEDYADVCYLPPSTNDVHTFSTSPPTSPIPYAASSYAVYPPRFKNVPLSSDAKEFVPRDMKVGATEN